MELLKQLNGFWLFLLLGGGSAGAIVGIVKVLRTPLAMVIYQDLCRPLITSLVKLVATVTDLVVDLILVLTTLVAIAKVHRQGLLDRIADKQKRNAALRALTNLRIEEAIKTAQPATRDKAKPLVDELAAEPDGFESRKLLEETARTKALLAKRPGKSDSEYPKPSTHH